MQFWLQRKLGSVLTLTVLAMLVTAVVAGGYAIKNRSAKQSAKPKPEPSPDEIALQKIWQAKAVGEKADAAIDVLNRYSNNAIDTDAAVFSVFEEPQEKKPTPEELHSAIKKLLDATTKAPANLRSNICSTTARELEKRGIYSEDAIVIAEQGIALLNEDNYIAYEKNRHDQIVVWMKTHHPTSEAEPFSKDEAVEDYKGFAAGQYATLGNLYLKIGKLDNAEDAYKNSYRIFVLKEAAVGLSRFAEHRGESRQALDYYVDAMLTGRLDQNEIEHLQELYNKVGSGGAVSLRGYLDAAYRSRYQNPLPTDAFQRRGSSQRTVVAELVSGSGCELCVSVDMAFEAELRRYPRSDLILLDYDCNSPSPDPLSNFGVEDRTKYYGVQGAPTLMLDGKNVNVGDGPRTEVQRVFGNLDEAIQKEMSFPPLGAISLAGKIVNGKVETRVSVSGLASQSKTLRLQIALVSQEVSYSGRNRLRFHSMVMRNLARPAGVTEYGFPISSKLSNIEYTFDLEQISAENFKYYNWYLTDMKERTGGSFKDSFNEKMNVIESHGLAIVAFMQDDATKQILQGTYTEVHDSLASPLVVK